MGLKEGYRQNVALLGNRYIGKTALLQRLMSQMEEEDLCFLYLDLENRDFNYFAVQFTKSLLYNFLKKENFSPSGRFEIVVCAGQGPSSEDGVSRAGDREFCRPG